MPRIDILNPENVQGETQELLDAIKAKMGKVPNIIKTMAHSPAVLKAYLGFSGGLGESALSDRLKEKIALVVGEAGGCKYCLSAHSAIADMVGVSAEEILDSRKGTSPDKKEEAALKFAASLIEKRGWVSDEEMASLREAGYGNGEIGEIVAVTCLNLFTNYFNHVAGTEIDFPKVPDL